jgi:hypothetical protein
LSLAQNTAIFASKNKLLLADKLMRLIIKIFNRELYMTDKVSENIDPWEDASLQNMKNWRSWGSWFSWGSPIGLGLFFLALAGSIWILKQVF